MKRWRASAWVALVARQLVLVLGAALAYFGVRGMTEGDVATANRNAERVLELERTLRLDLEQAIQAIPLDHRVVLNLANWTYIWLHWPLLIATLIWLLRSHRSTYFELRNAMFISGAIGLVIFATFPVTPPRLFDLDYIDTVTQHSYSYRVLQPPALTNKYAAMPSLHVGWNLLAGITWWRVGRHHAWRWAAIAMPLAMAWATVATANHWVLDAIVGASLALVGLGLERLRRAWLARRAETAVPSGSCPPAGAELPAGEPASEPAGEPAGEPAAGALVPAARGEDVHGSRPPPEATAA